MHACQKYSVKYSPNNFEKKTKIGTLIKHRNHKNFLFVSENGSVFAKAASRVKRKKNAKMYSVVC